MKKRIKAIIIIIMCAIFLIPFPSWYKDGGTVEYNAILYSIRKVHSIQAKGYDIGTQVRILFWTVYDDVRYVPDAK